MTNNSSLKFLENMRVTLQRERIRMGNRSDASERGVSDIDPEITNKYAKLFQSLEDTAKSDIEEQIKEHVMWSWFVRVKGIGPGLAGCLVAHVDIHRADTVSALWKYAGQGATNGERDRPVKGQKLCYNAELKRICYLIGTSFMKSHSPYVTEYARAKEYYQKNRPDWTPGHIHAAAQRMMIKLFLSHFWAEWRRREGLPDRAPYAIQVLQHDGFVTDEAFLKPEKKKRASHKNQ